MIRTRFVTSAGISGSTILLATVALSIAGFPVDAAKPPAQKPAYTVLHKFTGGEDGAHPDAALVADTEGDLYGTTCYGGAFDWGVVFKLDSSGRETVLHSFAGGDGMWPKGPVVLDTDGNLYGTTSQGGTPENGNSYFGCGTVFEIDTGGKYSVLYAFTGGTDGAYPTSSLLVDEAGSVYGTVSQGGRDCIPYGCGLVFKLDKFGKRTVLHTFTNGDDGAFPSSGLVWGAAGDLFGTTQEGGTGGYGTVYKLDSAGVESVLYNFTGGTDGGEPAGTLVRDEAGNFYGKTVIGGNLSKCDYAQKGCGNIFKVDSSGGETVLYDFFNAPFEDAGGLLRDQAGNLYGTSSECCDGVLFKLTPNGTVHYLHLFLTETGSIPQAGVVMDKAGNLYGTTYEGGLPDKCKEGDSYGCGVVYKRSLE
ncbi:MAG TPA: choice-of-anchor tandem repeat GloVer-containing protein [Terriglobales bacterium]